jgi:hypothetical protein
MGQIFNAYAYDTETKTCCVIDADKFHANCYAHSGTVLSIHYLLRQKPYNVMWGGGYVVIDDNLADFSRTEDLLGISTYVGYEIFEMNNSDLQSKSYYDKIKFIDNNSKLWKRIDVVPVLTETGGGTQMALLEGISADSTEELAGEWSGDLLQIVDELPEDYKLINCCFAGVWRRAEYCYHTFGVNEDGYILKDSNGKLFEAAKLNFLGQRGYLNYIKVELTADTIKYIPTKVNENKTELH